MKKGIKKIVFIALIGIVALSCSNPFLQKKSHEETGFLDEDITDETGGGGGGGGWPRSRPIFEEYFLVEFFPNNGVPAPGNQLVAKGAKVGKVPAMTRSSYGFAGWFEDDGIWAVPFDVTSDPVMSDLRLYARWITPVPYTVNFVDEDGISPLLDPFPIENGVKIPEPSVILKEVSAGVYMGFGGWWYEDPGAPGNYLEWNFSSDTVTGTVVIGTTLTLIAKWDVPYCTVRFEANGGTPAPFTQYLLQGANVIEPDAMNQTGYGFGGWYKDAGFNQPWNFGIDAPGIGVKNLTLYAKWVLNYCKVIFDADGGSPAPAALSMPFGELIPQPAFMTKAGMGFDGWFTDRTWATEWDFSSDLVTYDMTLFAKWSTAVYTVKFHTEYRGSSGNGTGPSGTAYPVPSDQMVSPDSLVSKPPYPERPNYSFAGWYSGIGHDDFTVTWEWDFDFPVTIWDVDAFDTLHLYARWVPNVENMAWVTGGKFLMGDDKVTGAKPAHMMRVEGFYISKFPVTQGEWTAVMGHNPANFKRPATPGGPTTVPTAPVEQISWFDAVAYCNELSDPSPPGTGWDYGLHWTKPPVPAVWPGPGPGHVTGGLVKVYNIDVLFPAMTWGKTGTGNYDTISGFTVSLNASADGYRLPTEAEWEYAARGGNGSPGNFTYAGSNDANEVAWYTSNTPVSGTQRIGQKAPNALGIYDMCGNVSEWCYTRYLANHYSSFPAPPSITPDSFSSPPFMVAAPKVRRGGSWNNSAANTGVKLRSFFDPDNATWVMGFRIVRRPSDQPQQY